MNLIIINGWSSQNSIWEDFVKKVSPEKYFIISTYDIFTSSKRDEPEKVLTDLIDDYAKSFTGNYFLLGWSLGGMMLVKVAELLAVKPVHAFIISAPTAVDSDFNREMTEALKNDASRAVSNFMAMAMTVDEKKRMYKLNADGRSKRKNAAFNDEKRNFTTEQSESLIKARNYMERGISEYDIKSFCISSSWIHGDSDRICNFENGKRTAALIGNCTFYEIKGAGHVPFVTQENKILTILKSVANSCV